MESHGDNRVSPNIIFEGLSRVSADGGPVQPATLVDFDRGENSHRWPVFLPDGIHFLFFVRASIDERRGVYIARLDRPASTPGAPLFRSESEAVFVPTSGPGRGVLLSAADGQLQARPFDAAALRLVGNPRTLPVAAGGNTPYHPAMLSASANLLATVATPMPYGVRLGTVARDGTAVRMSERQPQGWPRLSGDGKRIARQLVDPVRGNPDIWVQNLEDGGGVRVTTDTGSDVLPVWSPDGRRLAYRSGTLKGRRLRIAAADGTGVAEELPCPGANCEPTDWSPDGRSLIVNTRLPTNAAENVWSVSLEAGGAARPILSEPFPGPTHESRRRENGSPTCRRRLAGRWSPFARCLAHRAVAWSPSTVAANPSGAAMGGRFSTSISKAVFMAGRCTANRTVS